MLDGRRRRWSNITQAERLVFLDNTASDVVSIVGSLRDREVACSASDRQGTNCEFCVWRTVSSHLSHHPQEVLLAQFSLYVHKGGLKPDSFHFIYRIRCYIKIRIPCRKDSSLQCYDWMNELVLHSTLCTYRLNWARKTQRGWWDEYDDSALI